jgi:hypothetical protein
MAHFLRSPADADASDARHEGADHLGNAGDGL